MKIPDELLSAFVNGELDGPERHRIELAISHDRRIAQRVAKHRALRSRLHVALDDVLNQPNRQRNVPERKLFPGSAQIIDLARVRAARAQTPRARRTVRSPRVVLTMGLVIGLAAGILLVRAQSGRALTRYQRGALLAQGALAQALNEQLVGRVPSGANIRVTSTYRARNGSYCRTFAVAGSQSLAGLACRAGDQDALFRRPFMVTLCREQLYKIHRRPGFPG